MDSWLWEKFLDDEEDSPSDEVKKLKRQVQSLTDRLMNTERTVKSVKALVKAAQSAADEGDSQTNGWWLVPGEHMAAIDNALRELPESLKR